jgi:hypothetical protein
MLSHFSDLREGDDRFLDTRLDFMKALVFFNPDLRQSVTEDYLNWLWTSVSTGEYFGSSYAEYKAQFEPQSDLVD